MGGSESDRDLGPHGQGIDAPLPLGEQVDDLDPARAGESLADAGELLVESVLRIAIERLTFMTITLSVFHFSHPRFVGGSPDRHFDILIVL